MTSQEEIPIVDEGAAAVSVRPKKETVVDEEDEPEFCPQENEYEYQYFGFSPKGFVDSVYNAMDAAIKERMEILKANIQELNPNVDEKMLQEAINNVSFEMSQKLYRRFSKLETHLVNNIFLIPPHVLLPEDSIHEDERLQNVKKGELETEIRDLEKKATKCRYMNEHMSKELAIIETVTTEQNEVKERMDQALEIGAVLSEQRYATEQDLLGLTEILENNFNTGDRGGNSSA